MTFRVFRPVACRMGGLCAAVIAAAPMVSAGPSQADDAGDGAFPVSLENCGRMITIDAPPERAVSIGQGSTEIMLTLGLAESLVGTAVWVGELPEDLARKAEDIPRLADDDPSFESVIKSEPDLVAAQFEWHVGGAGAVATPEQFADFDIPVYVSPADCADKDNTTGGDGVRLEPFTMDLIYQEIVDIATIFGVSERGADLVDSLQDRKADAIARVQDVLEDDVSAVFWFSSPEMSGEAFVAGRNGAPAWIMDRLGVTNIVTTNEEWPLVGWETIAGEDPEVIVIADMDRRRYPADGTEAKRRFLTEDPVASMLQAVRHDRIIAMDAQAMNPTLRTVDGLEVLANGLRRFELEP